MIAGIIPNLQKAETCALTQKVCEILTSNGITPALADNFDGFKGGFKAMPEAKLYSAVDVIITIGGDGTIIDAAKRACVNSIPVLGINAGRIGFLAGLEPDELELLSRLKTGDYSVEERMLLNVFIDDMPPVCFLNDAIVSKASPKDIIDITAAMGEDSITYRADGLIIATPTGSTAYSMSAGGPIIESGVQGIILTPICAHSLLARPLIVDPGREISISVDIKEPVGAYITVDGEQICRLKASTKIKISKAEDRTVRLIKITNNSFYSILSEKIK